ncbi:MAG: glycosyltransferase family 87 protein [Candidatus Binatia bacterium]
MVLAFLCVVALVSYRAATRLNVPGHPDDINWVLQDFRDAVYYPAVAFLQGKNPYDPERYMAAYPVSRPLPLYGPVNLLIHLPFGLLPFEYSELAYYAFTILLTLALARLTLGLSGLPVSVPHTCGLAALILLSRPGQMNLLLGQVTLQCVIATYLALHYARPRPWLAGAGLAVCTFKPTFGLPLAVLMLCRRDHRAVTIGMTIAALLSTAVVLVLVRATGGVGAFLHAALATQQGFATQPFNEAVSAPFRIDAPALVQRLAGVSFGGTGKLLAALGVLSVGAVAVRRAAGSCRETPGRALSTTLVCLTVLTWTYHQAYDLLLLTLPVTALVADQWVPQGLRQPRLRWVLVILLGVLAVNYLASATVIEGLGLRGGWWLAATSLNGGVLLCVFGAYVWLVLRKDE